jgi:geranylgeranyl diphosphate synthase type II
MVAGQMLDMLSERRRLSRPELERLHALKTGAMIEAAVAAGAIAGRGKAPAVAHLRNYGRAVGLAFQVVDDILNVEGDAKVMGKAAGTDSQRGKNTYPALLGLAKSKEFAQNLVEEALRAVSALDRRAEPLRELARYIIARRR